MMKKPRENTCNLLDAIEEGMFDPMIVLEAALLYMSDDEVGDMMHANEFLIEEDEEDE